MSKGWKVWKWPQFLHGKGHDFYQSEEAKELYAKQLLSLSEKLFWLLFAPLLGYFLKPNEVDLLSLALGVFVILCLGLFSRHQGLRIIDELKTKKIKIEVSGFSR